MSKRFFRMFISRWTIPFTHINSYVTHTYTCHMQSTLSLASSISDTHYPLSPSQSSMSRRRLSSSPPAGWVETAGALQGTELQGSGLCGPLSFRPSSAWNPEFPAGWSNDSPLHCILWYMDTHLTGPSALGFTLDNTVSVTSARCTYNTRAHINTPLSGAPGNIGVLSQPAQKLFIKFVAWWYCFMETHLVLDCTLDFSIMWFISPCWWGFTLLRLDQGERIAL